MQFFFSLLSLNDELLILKCNLTKIQKLFVSIFFCGRPNATKAYLFVFLKARYHFTLHVALLFSWARKLSGCSIALSSKTLLPMFQIKKEGMLSCQPFKIYSKKIRHCFIKRRELGFFVVVNSVRIEGAELKSLLHF